MKMNKWVIFFALLPMIWSLSSIAQTSKDNATTLNLSATVKGNQEQPKVLSIIPWQSPDAETDLKTPINSLIETHFQHIEPAELRRQIHFIEESVVD